MKAPTLKRTIKPLTLSLTTLLILSLISTASATTGISATYSLQGNKTSMVERQYTLSGLHNFIIDESRNASLSASGTATVNWLNHEISANGSISLSRNVAFSINMNGTINKGSETETSTITFSGTGSDEVRDNFGPLMGHPSGTSENITINSQTYLAVHVSRNFTDHFTASAQETFTKTGDGGRTITVSVTRTVTRDITLSANFWFSKTSGILLKSSIQGNISIQIKATGTMTTPMGTENFTMTANYIELFSRTVTATSISGLSG